jgi:hypothetical protein
LTADGLRYLAPDPQNGRPGWLLSWMFKESAKWQKDDSFSREDEDGFKGQQSWNSKLTIIYDSLMNQ